MGSALWFQYTNSSVSVLLGQHPRCVKVDSYGIMIIDLNNVGYKDNPWVLASQVA
jgi:hypothetical protein